MNGSRLMLNDVKLVEHEENKGQDPPSPPQQWNYAEMPMNPILANAYTLDDPLVVNLDSPYFQKRHSTRCKLERRGVSV